MGGSTCRVLCVLAACVAPLCARAEVKGPPLPELPAIQPAPASVTPSVNPTTTSDQKPVQASSQPKVAAPAVEQRGLGKPKAAPALASNSNEQAALAKPTGAGSLLEAGSWERTTLSLVAVLGLIVLVMRVVRKYSMAQGLAGALGAGGRAPSGVLEVLARYPIARGQTLVLLRLDRRVLLCCHTRGGKLGAGGGMSVLTELTEPEEVATILVKTRDVASESIAQRFQSILSRSEHEADRVLATGAHAQAQTPGRRRVAQAEPLKALPKGEAGRAAAYGLDASDRVPTGADAADAIRRRLAAMRSQGVTA